MSHSLNSLKGGLYRGRYRGIAGVIKRDTRSLDYSSYEGVDRSSSWATAGCLPSLSRPT